MLLLEQFWKHYLTAVNLFSFGRCSLRRPVYKERRKLLKEGVLADCISLKDITFAFVW